MIPRGVIVRKSLVETRSVSREETDELENNGKESERTCARGRGTMKRSDRSAGRARLDAVSLSGRALAAAECTVDRPVY